MQGVNIAGSREIQSSLLPAQLYRMQMLTLNVDAYDKRFYYS